MVTANVITINNDDSSDDCSPGPPGPKGDQGPPGPEGPPGPPGVCCCPIEICIKITTNQGS